MHDDRVDKGMRRQLEGLGDIIGWKMGLTVPAVQEHLGLDGPVLGHLLRTSVIKGGEHSLAGGTSVAVEPELALEIATGRQRPSRIGLALEVVDLNRSLDELEDVLAENVFQRAVAFGPLREPSATPQVRLTVNGEARELPPPEDPTVTLAFVHEFLGRFGVQPQAGQIVIAGSLGPAIPVAPGDVLELSADGLGELALRITD